MLAQFIYSSRLRERRAGTRQMLGTVRIPCPVCDHPCLGKSALVIHFKAAHPELGIRDRYLKATEARVALGWPSRKEWR
jgi:hypothetical protein